MLFRGCLLDCMFVCLYVCLFACLIDCLLVCMLVCFFVCLFAYLLFYLIACLLACLFYLVCLACLIISLLVCLLVCLFACLPVPFRPCQSRPQPNSSHESGPRPFRTQTLSVQSQTLSDPVSPDPSRPRLFIYVRFLPPEFFTCTMQLTSLPPQLLRSVFAQLNQDIVFLRSCCG